jgi:tetratricopeptide (TPR) repeat protein
MAGDNLSLCRVYCYNGNTKAAIDLCNESNDSTASFHLARQFENKKDYKKAIDYYQKAGAISNAIRLCKVIDVKKTAISLF